MSTPSFLEGTPVGGVPWFAKMIHQVMPKSKRKREGMYRIQMVILTYSIYSLFNMTRRPLSIVKSRILSECDNNTFNSTFNKSGTWCDESIYLRNPEEFLGLMDFLFTFTYGVCLYASGVIADCYNPRYYLTTGCFLSGYFCALLGLCDYWNLRSFKFLGTMLILHGASQSTAWPVALSSVTHWYGVVGKRRGMFFGFWNTHNYLGSMIGILISVQWVDSRWMWSFFVPGFILAFAGIFVISCMLAHPKDFKILDKEKTLAIRKSSSTERRRSRQEEVPTWLSTKSSITMYEAWTLPGVIEFSTCMFFSRMVGYTFLFWLPVFLQHIDKGSASRAAYYSLAYVVGGSCGGIVAGVLVDLTRQSAIVCAFFLILSIPTLLLGFVPQFGRVMQSDFPLFLVIGLFVEAPYVVISTSVSADLGTHRLVKRNHRALSTVGGIIEGTGAIGASLGTFMSGIILVHGEWTTILYVLVACQFLALVCLSRQVYTEIYRKQKTEEEINYLKLPSVG